MARPKRTKIGQKTHDEKLMLRVEKYRDLGYKIEADLPEMKKPAPIAGMVPDLVGKKYGKIRIIEEVETPQTLASDKEQQQKFKDKASALGAKYRTILAKRKK